MMTDPKLPNPIDLAIPVFAVLILGEILWARWRRRDAYEVRDTATSLLISLGFLALSLLQAGLVYASLEWAYSHRIFDFGYALWAYPLLFLADDFCYYWLHRLSHEHRFWWAAHIVHHSSQHYNLSTALRQTWTGVISGTFVMYMPLAFLGFPPPLIIFQKGVSLVYQFWIHTEAIDRTPRWFEAVFNTPSHHRVHHASNPRYLDANYAGILIIWDRMFGTAIPEDGLEPIRYGVVRNIGTFNPLRVAFHEWVGIFKDLRHARTFREALMYTFGPPGWSPDGSRMTSRQLRAAWRQRQNEMTAEARAAALLDQPARKIASAPGE